MGTKRWWHVTMLVSGVAIWLVNAWLVVRGFSRMDLIQGLSAGMVFLILPPLLWRDWQNARVRE